MKKTLVVISIVVTLAVAALIVLTLRINDVVAVYKPTIEAQLSNAIGATVILGELEVSVLPSLTLGVAEVSLMGENNTKLPVSLERLKANARLMPLLSKRLELTRIEIVRPQITAVKSEQGISIEGLKGPKKQTPQPGIPPTTSSSGEAAAPLTIDIERVEITDGTFTLNDTTASKRYTVKNVDLSTGVTLDGSKITIPDAALNFSLDNAPPLNVTATAIVFDGGARTVSLGSVELRSDVGSATVGGDLALDSGKGALTLSIPALALDKLAAALAPITPALETMRLAGNVSVKAQVTDPTSPSPKVDGTMALQNVAASPSQAAQVSGTAGTISFSGLATDLVVATESLALNYQNAPLTVAFRATVRPHGVQLAQASVKGFKGSTQLSGTLDLGGTKPYRANMSATSLSIEELLAAFKPDLSSHVAGTIASFSVKPAGALSGDVLGSLSADGSLHVTDGVLKGTNLGNVVLSKIDSLPFLSGSLRAQVPPAFERYLTKPDTEIREMRTTFSLSQKVATVSSFSLTSDIFSLDSNGTASFDGDVRLNTTIYFTKEFSDALVAQNKNVKNIVAADGRLIVPLSIEGRAPTLLVLPNLAKIIETGAAKALQEKATSAIEKALGDKGKKSGLGKALGGALGF